MTPTAKLTRIRVAGFRSLRDVTVEPAALTLLIGPNGAGKSNLLAALEMVRLLAFGTLQRFVGERGGASYLMHYGPRETSAIDLELEFGTEDRQNAYQARLGYGADESLIFLVERAGYRRSTAEPWRWVDLGAGHRETRLPEQVTADATVRTVLWHLKQINFYHFHDTSRRSALRTRPFADVAGNYLRSDGSNLPTFLYGLKTAVDDEGKAAWRRIEGTLKRIAPFIVELMPEEDRTGVRLEWQNERGGTFGPAHLSDGTLRALALIAALAQPQDQLPLVSCIDEPELGLHPAALTILGDLLASVAARRQVILSTQSPVLLDIVSPDDVIVAERDDGATTFRRLDEAALAAWLEDYSLSELYDKNVLGGRP